MDTIEISKHHFLLLKAKMNAQKCRFKFYIKTEKKRQKACAEIYAALVEAHGEDYPSQANVCRWFVNEECMSSPGNKIRGWSSSTTNAENVLRVKSVIEANPCTPVPKKIYFEKNAIYFCLPWRVRQAKGTWKNIAYQIIYRVNQKLLKAIGKVKRYRES